MLRPRCTGSRDPFTIIIAVLAVAVLWYITIGSVSFPGLTSFEGILQAGPASSSLESDQQNSHPVSKELQTHPVSKEQHAPAPSKEQLAPAVSKEQPAALIPEKQHVVEQPKGPVLDHSGAQHDDTAHEKPSSPPAQETRAKLKHLMLPATKFNEELCKAVATSFMLDYPGPTVVGLQEKRPINESDDSELAAAVNRGAMVYKSQVVLEYLESLPPSAQDDLAISMDAYDAWLMLRPEVVEARYYSILKDADERLEKRGILGKDNNGTAIKSRIVFGSDQSCWPAMTQQRRSCAAPPMSPLYDNASLAPPIEGMPENARWLNAGVFMGPVADLKRLLQDAVKLMAHGYSHDYQHRWDDQGALGDLFGQQELERSELAGDGRVLNTTEGHDAGEWIKKTVGSERGMTVDYDSRLIQNAHGSLNYLSWREYKQSDKGLEPIKSSRAPFSEYGHTKSWEETPTGINSGTHSVFPIFHMTVQKQLRWEVWPKHWIHTFGNVTQFVREPRSKVVMWSPQPDLTEERGWEGTCRWWEHVLFS